MKEKLEKILICTLGCFFLSLIINTLDIKGINYFNAFCQIKPTHIEEAQILLDSENPFGIVALQTLIENGHIKGNLEELKTENEIKQQELKIVKQNVHSAWQAHKKQAQHTR